MLRVFSKWPETLSINSPLSIPYPTSFHILTIGVFREAWLWCSLLVRPLRVGSLWRSLWVGHLGVRTWGKSWAFLGEAWLSISSCRGVGPLCGLSVVRRGHAETRLGGSIDVVVEGIVFPHDGEATLVLRHGVVVGSLRSYNNLWNRERGNRNCVDRQ